MMHVSGNRLIVDLFTGGGVDTLAKDHGVELAHYDRLPVEPLVAAIQLLGLRVV